MTLSSHTYSAPFSIKSCHARGTFSGYASVFDELDNQGDRVAKGAFQASLESLSLGKVLPKMLWQHDAREPIGVWEEIREDPHGLFVKGRLILELRRAQEAYALLKERACDGLSIGYRVVQAVRGKTSQERLLTQLDLVEISLVTFPANSSAKILNLKAQEDLYDDVVIQTIQKTICLLKS